MTAVLDGDSLAVQVRGVDEQVRLLGINTPERDECFADRARAETAALVGDAAVSLMPGAEDRDQFGRLLRYVYAADGTFVNRALVEGGYALAITADHPLLADFKEAEAAAFTARLGMWAPEACGPASAGRGAIAGILFDAPGPDADNPNGEWVEIANRGPEALDLSGWMVRDESSQHRFEFPAGTILQPGSAVRVLSGCGVSSAQVLFWCADGAVWSNNGDTGYLMDPSGNIVDRSGY